MPSRLEAALQYASWGWHVLPVVPNGKEPVTLHGVHDATRDQKQITDWWIKNPNYNIGIASGNVSGILVFDVDPRNGGEESWQKWTETHGAAPDGIVQLTAGGGQHYIAFYDEDLKSCKLADGIDLLADGRYFLAWPSCINGKSYEWEGSSDPTDGIAPMVIPQSWKDAYLAKRKTEPKHKAATGELIKGNRNDGLTSMGGAMRHYGFTEAEIMAALSVANETRCEMPLPSSELAQIVRSVSRYEPEHDIAADVALGSQGATDLLDSYKAATSDYYYTQATSYLSQPSPLEWIIKGWIPDQATSMVYGESGVGKTFITLDMACHIACGMEWHGHKIKAGTVIYMAGEGNYGLRQRVKAWCLKYQVSQLDNLYISNRGIDMDSPVAAAKIINAVREATNEPITAVFVDTVNNHMSGDENSARDTRNMFNACKIVASALGSSVILNHHTGHSGEAKTRARGSSAWKASLDAAVLVSGIEDGLIEVSCTKMKDAEPPKSFYGKLEQIDLGWPDEDGSAIMGAVFTMENGVVREEKPASKKPAKHNENLRIMELAWIKASGETRQGKPYITRSALHQFLIDNIGMMKRTADNKIQPSRPDGIIMPLINDEIIQYYEYGWIFINDIQISAMMMRKNVDNL